MKIQEVTGIDSDTEENQYKIGGGDDVLIPKWTELISRECRSALHYYKMAHRVLYRGTKRERSIAYAGTSRPNRSPQDMRLLDHDRIEELLHRAGYQARRTNSIFASPLSSVASEYGQVYVVFPSDAASITWNKAYSDLYTDLTSRARRDRTDYTEFDAKLNAAIDTKDAMTCLRTAVELGFVEDRLEEALRSMHEVYISGPYYALKDSTMLANGVLRNLGLLV